MSETRLHASCASVDGCGVLLLGPPGTGKSSLVLRLIDQPGTGIGGKLRMARLVADDQVVIRRSGNQLTASAPPVLAGKLEIRGLGIVDIDFCPSVNLVLVVKLMSADDIDRMPEPDACRTDLLGVELSLLHVDGNDPAGPARIRAAIDLWCKAP